MSHYKVTKDDDAADEVFWCYKCETYFMVPEREFNCRLVVHLAINGAGCNPHLSRAACAAARRQPNAVGCGRQYRIVGNSGEYGIEEIVGEHL